MRGRGGEKVSRCGRQREKGGPPLWGKAAWEGEGRRLSGGAGPGAEERSAGQRRTSARKGEGRRGERPPQASVSKRMVTGPSLTLATAMSAPKMPWDTGKPRSRNRAMKAS